MVQKPVYAFFDPNLNSCKERIELAYLRADDPIDGKGDVVLPAVVIVVAPHVEVLIVLGGVDLLGNAAGEETCQRIRSYVIFPYMS